MAGLLATRVLARHFTMVTLIERDCLSDRAEHRKGVPQGQHFHILLKRGERALTQLFPDLGTALVAGGATVVDIGADMQIYQFGGFKIRCPTGADLLFLSRPFLEWHVRSRVLSVGNVTTRQEHEVTGLVTTEDRARVTGVTLARADRARPLETLAADLVIDASGRGSQTPAWLEAFGYLKPPETTVTVDIGYTSRVYRRTPRDLPGTKAAYALPKPPGERRFGALFPMEGDRWIAELGGWLGEHAPAHEQGFLEFARSLPSPEIARALPRLEPLSDFAVHRFPANRRRHYERSDRFPERYLVVGDAMCSFNPVYGQGMTVSALEAQALDGCLSGPNGMDLRGLAPRFFAEAARAIDPAWLLTTSEDLRHPGAGGARPVTLRLLNWYTGCVFRAATRDAEVLRAFLEVMGLVRRPVSLLRPRIVARALAGGLR
ncbi:MAG: hypothetical protein AUH78_01155 [Gemmatimonadetes bacterium 13_1_40CM_4_69_8]|nr:MAG: hypothetical protein AUH78_01155 [Gemmatimonadetes bacterium 13_1_40CM_4_69_8]